MWKDIFRWLNIIIGGLEASDIKKTGMFFHRGFKIKLIKQ